MAIEGIGVDIEQIGRFEEKPFETNEHFYRKVFTEDEIAYCLAQPQPAQHFAARFSAKEAAIKALETTVEYHDIEVFKDGDRPALRVGNKDAGKLHLSLSHAGEYAIAYVVIER